ncbi:unnamed protein product [Amoebophrya sp. A120]|nr:unnamed protein product [Amoebophrya sp. A120]|eukprot:GSA120T00023835001.1
MMVGQLLATRGDEKSAAPPLGCTGSSASGFHVHAVKKMCFASTCPWGTADCLARCEEGRSSLYNNFYIGR